MPYTETDTIYECPIPGCCEESIVEKLCPIHNVKLVPTVHPRPVPKPNPEPEPEHES